jgi:predicted glycosyltransferase involved in capsule biosynthesis
MVMRQVSHLWHKMNKKEKENYKSLSDADRARFDYERKEFKADVNVLKIWTAGRGDFLAPGEGQVCPPSEIVITAAI